MTGVTGEKRASQEIFVMKTLSCSYKHYSPWMKLPHEVLFMVIFSSCWKVLQPKMACFYELPIEDHFRMELHPLGVGSNKNRQLSLDYHSETNSRRYSSFL